MNTFFTLLISVIPVILVLIYVYKKDRDKEPKNLLVKLFVLGIISCLPAGILELIFDIFFGGSSDLNTVFLFLYTTIGIALIEEICKWFIVYRVAYNNKEFDHPYDAIVYCVFVSLGFACLENVLYVLSYGVLTGFFRAFTSIPGHVGNAIVMGNFLALAKDDEAHNRNSSKNLLLSIIMPALLHGLYDFFVFSESTIYLLFFAIFIVLIYIFGIRKIKKMANISDNYIKTNNIKFCPTCGAKRVGRYCSECGREFELSDSEINISNDLTH